VNTVQNVPYRVPLLGIVPNGFSVTGTEGNYKSNDVQATVRKQFSRHVHVRFDDPKTGWKGRGLRASTETPVVWRVEAGMGQVPQMVHFQLTPHPPAR